MDATPYYQELARALRQLCPRDFTSAEIVASLDAGYAEIAYRCDGPWGPKAGLDAPFDLDRSVSKALHGLRDAMPGHRQWSNCTFRLADDGAMRLDVAYPDEPRGGIATSGS